MLPEKQKLLYEGKAKKVYTTSDSEKIIVYFKDDATAFNAQKKGTIQDKGIVNNGVSELLFEYLASHSIPSHFIKRLNKREQLCQKVTIFPLEVIVRNWLAGSTAKMLGIAEGTILSKDKIIYELCYKKDELGDPLINDYHAIALGLATQEELQKIYFLTKNINTLLSSLFDKIGIILVDFKIEFGKTSSGDIILADEISPDSCRLWEKETLRKMDKDRFRRDLGDIEKNYKEVLKRIETHLKK